MKRLFASVFCALLLQGSALATTLQTQIGDISIPTAKEINEQIDEVAEHILSVGGQPLGTLKDYLLISQIKEAENVKVEDTVVFDEVKKGFAILLGEVISIKKKADEHEEYKTSTIMDNFVEDYTKKLWMLKQMAE